MLTFLNFRALLRYTMALLYDGLILLSLWLASTALALILVTPEQLKHWQVFFWAYLLVVSFLWTGFCWRKTGQTIGSKCWKLKVEPLSGDQMDWWLSLRRYACALACIPTGLFIVSLLMSTRAQPYPARLAQSTLRKTTQHLPTQQ